MASTESTFKPTNRTELIAHWRASADEIRSSVREFPELDNETKANAATTAELLDRCAAQLESLPTI